MAGTTVAATTVNAAIAARKRVRARFIQDSGLAQGIDIPTHYGIVQDQIEDTPKKQAQDNSEYITLNLFHPVLEDEMSWSAAVVTRQGSLSLVW
ncbi:hypothetical protein ACFV2S_34555 [Streptomyces sp. NPDC059695]|uniref:hypothetical protein n=1 Tax=Streptomyces sp. NPDC059695 TaxID=3346910 RepID=UPI00369649B3